MLRRCMVRSCKIISMADEGELAVQTRWMFGLLLLLAACSSKPSDDQAKEALRTKIAAGVEGAPFQITSMEKTNGQSMEVNGIDGYRYFYRASVAFPEGYRPECIVEQGRFAGFDCAFAVGIGRSVVRPQPKGAIATYVGEITFQRAEKGWLLGPMSVTQESQIISPEYTADLERKDPNLVAERDWKGAEGVVIIFDSPAASTKAAAASVTSRWSSHLNRAGVTSYRLEWHSPNHIMLCAQARHEQSLAGLLFDQTPGVQLRALSQATGRCDYHAAMSERNSAFE